MTNVQQSLLHLILDVIPYVVFWKDRDSVYLGVNRNFAALAGRPSPADIVGLTDYDLPWTREESDAYRADDREVMESGTPKLHIVESQLNAAGKRTWLDTSKVPLRNEAGEVIGVLGIYADITELEQASAELQQTRQHLEDAIDAIDAGLVMYDKEEKLVFCNGHYREIYDEVRDLLEPGQPYGRILSEFAARNPHLLGDQTPEQWIADRLAHHRSCQRWEQVLGNRVIQVSDRRTRDGGIVSLRTDITAERARERELQRAKEAAVTANVAKTSFLANLSHEIRTPMTAILGFTDVLANSNPLPDQVECLQTIQRNGEHLLDLIDDILDLSKIEAGKLRVEHRETDLVALLEAVRALMAVRADGKGLRLELRLAPELPRTIDTDATRLRQILVNLVGNAIKFTETGSVTLTVDADRTAGVLSIAVEDTGIGIAAEHLQRVFEPFEQADASVTRCYGGSGLGLAISRRLAMLLGGDLQALSQVGVGSVFTLLHPVPATAVWQRSGPVRDAAQPPRSDDRPSTTALLGRRILLVEDGPDNRRLLTNYLAGSGAIVETANDGQYALDRFASGECFDLVLMDMQMPRLDGYEATRRLRELGCAMPIVALTAHAMTNDRQRCLDAGCSDYLSKPVRRAKLVGAVAEWLQRRPDDAALRG